MNGAEPDDGGTSNANGGDASTSVESMMVGVGDGKGGRTKREDSPTIKPLPESGNLGL